MNAALDGLSEEDLLRLLPANLAKQIGDLGASETPWDQVGILLGAAPTAGIALKGGGRWTGTLWVAVKRECHSFLCTDSAVYADLRQEWGNHVKKGSPIALASLSGVIGAQLGVASGAVAPLVIWALVVGLRIGKRALCQSFGPDVSAPPTDPAPPVVG